LSAPNSNWGQIKAKSPARPGFFVFAGLSIRGSAMTEDERCCGTGTCIIDAQGRCWCGQRWDGEKMCRPPMDDGQASAPEAGLDTDAH